MGAPVVLRPLSEIVADCREPRWLLHRILEAEILAVLAGPRSTFKSFIALDWVMRAATSGFGAVILSGEGAGLDRRVAAWMKVYGAGEDLISFKVVAMERAKNLNLATELNAVADAIGALPYSVDLIVVDTLSKFSAGLDENSNFEMAEFLSRLAAGLRDRFKCTVLLVAHSGHADSKRPRGASALMANPDAEFIVARPDATSMTVTVTRERFKDYPSLEPLAYEAQVIDLGRQDNHGEPVASLVLSATALPTAQPREPSGAAQRTLLAALKRLDRDGGLPISTLTELRAIARGLGLSKASARTAVDGLTLSAHMTATIGGYKLSHE